MVEKINEVEYAKNSRLIQIVDDKNLLIGPAFKCLDDKRKLLKDTEYKLVLQGKNEISVDVALPEAIQSQLKAAYYIAKEENRKYEETFR